LRIIYIKIYNNNNNNNNRKEKMIAVGENYMMWRSVIYFLQAVFP